MTDNIQKDAYIAHGTLLNVTGLLDGEGVQERMNMCIAEYFHCCETITTLLMAMPYYK